MKSNLKETSILVVSNPTNIPQPQTPIGINSILIYGGVSVAVILAIAVLCDIFLKRIDTLLKTFLKYK